MLFASEQLASRIERAECRLLRDCATAIAARPHLDSGRPTSPRQAPLVLDLAGGIATWTGADSPLNKLAGLGFHGLPSEAELERVEAAFAERSSTLRAEVSTLADPGVHALLSTRGYRTVNFENVLGMGLDGRSVPREVEGIEVELGGDDQLEDWLDTVVEGFAHPDAQGVASDESIPREVLEPILRDMGFTPGFRHYLARIGGRLAGAASLRLFEGIAQLCGAATLAPLRRRGVQTALFARRLRDSIEQDCEFAVLTAQPGSKSQQNAQARGFELLYARSVMVLEPG